MEKKLSKKPDVFSIILFVFLLLFSISLFYLLFWSLSTSLKSQEEFRLNQLGLPQKMTFDNFKLVYDYFYVEITPTGQMPRNVYLPELFGNTVLYVVGCAFLQTLTPLIVAYAVTKFDFKFNAVVDGIVFVVMILPIVGSYSSELRLLHQLNLYDTMVGMWIQKTNFAGLYFLVFTAAFRSITKSYYEAAYIDGANEFQVMVIIAIPMVIYTFFTVFLIQFISYWNDYQTVLLYLPSWPTLSLGLYDLSTTTIQVLKNTPVKVAGCMIVMIPTLIIFAIFSKQLMGNISIGGEKE